MLLLVLHLKLLSFFNDELSVEGLKDHLDFFVSLLRDANQLHIVLFQVFSYVFCILKRGKHHIIDQLVDAIAHRFEAMLQDLIKFDYYIIENFVL